MLISTNIEYCVQKSKLLRIYFLFRDVGDVAQVGDFAGAVGVADVVAAAFKVARAAADGGDHGAVEAHVGEFQFADGVAAKAQEVLKDVVVALQGVEYFKSIAPYLRAPGIVVFVAAVVRAEFAVVSSVGDGVAALKAGAQGFYSFVRHWSIPPKSPQRCKAKTDFQRENRPLGAIIYVS